MKNENKKVLIILATILGIPLVLIILGILTAGSIAVYQLASANLSYVTAIAVITTIITIFTFSHNLPKTLVACAREIVLVIFSLVCGIVLLAGAGFALFASLDLIQMAVHGHLFYSDGTEKVTFTEVSKEGSSEGGELMRMTVGRPFYADEEGHGLSGYSCLLGGFRNDLREKIRDVTGLDQVVFIDPMTIGFMISPVFQKTNVLNDLELEVRHAHRYDMPLRIFADLRPISRSKYPQDQELIVLPERIENNLLVHVNREVCYPYNPYSWSINNLGAEHLNTNAALEVKLSAVSQYHLTFHRYLVKIHDFYPIGTAQERQNYVSEVKDYFRVKDYSESQ